MAPSTSKLVCRTALLKKFGVFTGTNEKLDLAHVHKSKSGRTLLLQQGDHGFIKAAPRGAVTYWKHHERERKLN